MTWLPFDKCLWCFEKSQIIYLKACKPSLLAEPHRLTINDAFADKWFFLFRLANEIGDEVWRQMNIQMNVSIYYNTVRNKNKLPQIIPPIQPSVCQFQCIFGELTNLIVCFLSFPSVAQKGQWLSGFFDYGSFSEIMQPWAQTVVVGRAR